MAAIYTKDGRLLYEDGEPQLRHTVRNAHQAGVYFVEADFADADLHDIDLTDAYLNGANLRSANLSGTVLRRAKLIEADLREANCTRADFTQAHLSRADLRGAVVRDADFYGADLSFATLSGVDFTKAVNLEYADLTGTDIIGILHSGRRAKGRVSQVVARAPVDPHANCSYVGRCVLNLLDPHVRACR